MIRIRITGAECEVAGSPADLRRAAKALERVSRTGLEEKITTSADFDPRPYHEALALLRVIRADGPERVSRESGSLIVSAATDGLTRIASLFDMPDELQDGYHCHHDASSDSRIASDSLSLVVTVERESRPIQTLQPTRGDAAANSGSPLLRPGEMTSDWRVVIVCHHCFHKLEPDMWISDLCWKSLNPITPFEQLPRPVVEKHPGDRFEVEAYAQRLQ